MWLPWDSELRSKYPRVKKQWWQAQHKEGELRWRWDVKQLPEGAAGGACRRFTSWVIYLRIWQSLTAAAWNATVLELYAEVPLPNTNHSQILHSEGLNIGQNIINPFPCVTVCLWGLKRTITASYEDKTELIPEKFTVQQRFTEMFLALPPSPVALLSLLCVKISFFMLSWFLKMSR